MSSGLSRDETQPEEGIKICDYLPLVQLVSGLRFTVHGRTIAVGGVVIETVLCADVLVSKDQFEPPVLAVNI